MKSLYESLLDDLDKLEQNQTNSLRNDILAGTWFRLGSDMKTIIFDPEEIDYLMDNRDTDVAIYWTKKKNYERNINISNIDVCKKLGLKFQPLAYIYNDIIGHDKEWLAHFDCEYAVNFNCHMMEGNRGATIDLSLIKFPIKGSISITGYAEVGKVIPYPNYVEVVRFFVPSQQPITGWKCGKMIIGNASTIKANLVKDKKSNISGEEQDMIFQDWINELLKNNPDAETIFLGQLGPFADCFKVVTKGSGDKRKCVKLSKIPNGKWGSIIYDKEVEKMERDVEAWRWQHADLYECDGATLGNTLGMGNPMAPNGVENGTEPVIPKYPRNKKKRKSIKESLLDDFDEIVDKADINIFKVLCDSKSTKEFKQTLETLLSVCTKMKLSEAEKPKYKSSFFLHPDDKHNGLVLVVGKLFQNSKSVLEISGRFPPVLAYRFTDWQVKELLEQPDLTLYLLPNDLEEHFIKWLQNNTPAGTNYRKFI